MAVLVLKCIQQRQRITKELCSHLGKLMTCKQDVEKMLPEISQCLDEMKDFESKIIMYQKQRQKDIWTLLRYVMQNFHKERAVTRRSSNSNSNGATTPDSPNIKGLVSMLPDKLSPNSIQIMSESSSMKERFDTAFESIKSDIHQNVEDSSGLDWTFIDVADHAPAITSSTGLVTSPPTSVMSQSTGLVTPPPTSVMSPTGLVTSPPTSGTSPANSVTSATASKSVKSPPTSIAKPLSSTAATAGSATGGSTASGGEYQG